MKKCYHKRVLPSPSFKKIVIDTYLNDFFLLRYSDHDRPIKKGEKNLASHFSASQFYGGLSVNLLSVYRKQDACFKVIGSKDDPQHQPWNDGDAPFAPFEKILKYSRYRGFVGIRIKHLLRAKIDKRPIKVQGVTLRNDKAYFKLEHAPTVCNFWHFNIHIEAVNSETNQEYLLKDLNGYSNNQLTKVAVDLLHQIEDYVKPRKYMYRYNLPKCYYK